ncbi:MAG: AAA family ATPase [Clostridiales bacterium]|jgi:predicted AAA+ superfamily ATPase|nr:AAA family ATPase [Clostridiales bacterium]
MLKRKFSEFLLRWKNDVDKTCLLVKGARQVGKTYVIDLFAKENYKNYIYINFETSPDKKAIFDGDLDVGSVLRRLSVHFPAADLTPGETLIFLDEIQSCPNARVAFKNFSIDKRFDVIGSGSLLGVNYKEVGSYPAGYETAVDLYSLDFEEFLWGLGVKPDTVSYLADCVRAVKPIDEGVLQKMREYFGWYIITGGMPKVVETFARTDNFGKVLQLQRSITTSYLDDVTKYAPRAEKGRARMCFESIPNQLAKKNKKFRYAEIENAGSGSGSAGARRYEGSLTWLYDAGIINYCHNLYEPALPLAANVRADSFKIYMRDTGLLISMMEDGVQAALLGDALSINEGGIVENVCADIFVKSGKRLTYFERKGKLEVDFVFNLGGVAAAIEIKSGDSLLSKSLDSIAENYKTVKRRIKLEKNCNVYVDAKGVEHYPLFAAMFI